MGNRITAIYGLVHPVTGELRYIGKSVQPEVRLRQHIQEAVRGDQPTVWCKRWINGLLRQGLEPEMIIIEEGRGEFWREAEAFWIAYFRSIGSKLINLAPGGIGVGEMSPALKQKRSAAARVGNLSRSHDEKKEIWVVTEPDGTVHEVLGLAAFCKERGLENSCMIRVALGQRKQYKGWLCWKKDTGPAIYQGVAKNNLSHKERNAPKKSDTPKWRATDPTGKAHDIWSLNDFCRQRGLHSSPFAQAMKEGRLYMGWKLERI